MRLGDNGGRSWDWCDSWGLGGRWHGGWDLNLSVRDLSNGIVTALGGGGGWGGFLVVLDTELGRVLRYC